jgi:hypothetical protein
MRNIGLLLVSAVFLTALSACSDIEEGLADSTPSAPAYRFEPDSRAIFEPLQIESSRHPRVALRAAGRLFVMGRPHRGPCVAPRSVLLQQWRGLIYSPDVFD